MNNKFDELTKSLAQSVTRRAALKKFGVGLAGMALACLGLANSASAGKACSTDADCGSGKLCCNGTCVKRIPDWCTPGTCCCHCVGKGRKEHPETGLSECDPNYLYCKGLCGADLLCGGTFV